jgi:hypothetical protein
MKDLKRRLFGSEAIEREVDEELQFHLDALTEQHLQNAGTFEEAQASALKRFGDVEQVRDECVEISKRSRAVVRALKSLTVLVFLGGILLRIFSTELHVDRVGQMLIAIGVMGRLFLYVRSLKPAVFRQKSDTSSPLMLRQSKYKSPTSLFDPDNL